MKNKNLMSMDDFKGKKSTKVEAPVNEMVDAIDDVYRVSVDVDLQKSLVSSFIFKFPNISWPRISFNGFCCILTKSFYFLII